MNHADRCQLLVQTFRELGYGFINNEKRGFFSGKSRDPDDCDQGYIFYPEKLGVNKAHNYQMFRGYVHDNDDIYYLRVNIPGFLHGLGQPPLIIRLQEIGCNNDLSEKIALFCATVSISATVVDKLMTDHCQRTRGTKKQEVVPCSYCKGSGDAHTHLHETTCALKCKLCGGKGTRTQITEQYYLED